MPDHRQNFFDFKIKNKTIFENPASIIRRQNNKNIIWKRNFLYKKYIKIY